MKIFCEIQVESDNVEESKSIIEQMMDDYFKHYVETTKIIDLKFMEKTK